jgi:hypothetical protein
MSSFLTLLCTNHTKSIPTYTSAIPEQRRLSPLPPKGKDLPLRRNGQGVRKKGAKRRFVRHWHGGVGLAWHTACMTDGRPIWVVSETNTNVL